MARSENRKALENFLARMDEKFGDQKARTIMEVLIEEVGGLRLTVPSLRDMAREERNRKIRKQFTGFNHREISQRWGLSVSQVRRVVSGE